ncbi:hypothetical protein GKE82_11165 [Conexibacter sp. W3-3-2]|uniref:homing endonuclease associated repeat-containing protein n=1 Tax=Conexibacter sp. W3-3-2 TaxID=2675227 RepID=UPI0012B6D4B9|nr:helix-turn-helix domain-containing protein [Conexibacter sp. W3-3-2]MTD44835.1 hypothetical protein [Conexibacter sp. W3-3-2]
MVAPELQLFFLDQLASLAAELGRTPTRAAWDEARDAAALSSATLIACYGAWSLVLLAAGLQPPRRVKSAPVARPTGPAVDPEVAARRARAATLHEQGVSYAEIGRMLGVSRATAYRDVQDPERVEARAARERRKEPCPGCGGPKVAEGAAVSAVCWDCAHALRRGNARARTIQAMQAWAARHGEPPTSTDWSPAALRRAGREADADAVQREGWPPASSVQRLFGSWNAAVELAGFRPRGPGRPATYRRPR